MFHEKNLGFHGRRMGSVVVCMGKPAPVGAAVSTSPGSAQSENEGLVIKEAEEYTFFRMAMP